MDLDEWELLPDSKSLLDFGHEDGGKQLLLKELPFDDELVLDMNYFICPSKSITTRKRVGDEDNSGDDRRTPAVKEAAADDRFNDIGGVVPLPMILDVSDVVSHVFFKKMKENEFADVKVTPPKSCCRVFNAPLPEPEPCEFCAEEEEVHDLDHLANEMAVGAAEGTEAKSCEASDMKNEQGFRVRIGGWKLTGVGALCSIGVAAATICFIFVLGGRQRQKQQRQRHKIQFQIYAEEKRIKHAVHQATRLNHALSAVRGAPMKRAHISFGGYYEGL